MSNPKDLGLQGVAEKMDERLDEETERRIQVLIDFAVEHGHPKIKALPEQCNGCQTQRDALRNHIRTLVSDAVVDYLKDKNFIIGDADPRVYDNI